MLSKITGGSGGGGIVTSSGSTDYQSFERIVWGRMRFRIQKLILEQTVAKPREVIRRASLLLAAKVASDESIARAKDPTKRGEIIKLMRGEDFHDFLTSGANDRLLTDGLEVKDKGAIEFGYFNANDPAGDGYPYFQCFTEDCLKAPPGIHGKQSLFNR